MIGEPTVALKAACDVAASCVTIGALAGFLPNIAALCAIVWYAIRFYEYARGKFKS